MDHERFRIEYEKRKKNDTDHKLSQYDISKVLMSTPFDIVLSDIDCEQRYKFIYNSHPDFNEKEYLGKRDDEIDAGEESHKLRELKKQVITTGQPEHTVINFPSNTGAHNCSISIIPRYNNLGKIVGATCASADITHLNQYKKVLPENKSVNEIKILKGILPLCSFCKSIRDEQGAWESIDAYITKHTEAQISHAICPSCLKSHYPEYYNRS